MTSMYFEILVFTLLNTFTETTDRFFIRKHVKQNYVLIPIDEEPKLPDKFLTYMILQSTKP